MGPADLDTRIAAFGDLVGDVRRALLDVEIGRCDLDQLALVKSSVDRLCNSCGPVKSDIAVRASELRVTDHSNIVDDTLDPEGRQSPHEEQTAIDRAGVLDNLPGMDDAARAGDLPAVYADVIATALANLPVEACNEFYRRHQDLAGVAGRVSVVEFRRHVGHLVERLLADLGVERAERQRRQRKASTFTDHSTGLWGLTGRWDPLAGHRLDAAIRAEVNAIYHARRDDPSDGRTREQVTADAIANLICGTPLSNQSPNEHNTSGAATVVVICDERTAEHGPHNASVHEYTDGTPVAFDTLTGLLHHPDSSVIPATVNEHGVVQHLGNEPLDHGRHKRCASPAQRLALRVMHRSCLIPGCDVPFDACEQHHLVEWRHDGRTDLVDLGPVCTRHHHQLHAHDWQLWLDPDTRQLTITYPDGTTRTHPHTGLAPPGHDPPGRSPPASREAPSGSDPTASGGDPAA